MHVFIYYAENKSENNDYTISDGRLVQEINLLGFPSEFKIIKFGTYSTGDNSRGLTCIIKDEGNNNGIFYSEDHLKKITGRKIQKIVLKKVK